MGAGGPCHAGRLHQGLPTGVNSTITQAWADVKRLMKSVISNKTSEEKIYDVCSIFYQVQSWHHALYNNSATGRGRGSIKLRDFIRMGCSKIAISILLCSVYIALQNWSFRCILAIDIVLHSTGCRASWQNAALVSVRAYGKNPCMCENRTFPNEMHHQGLESMIPQGNVWFLHGHRFLLLSHDLYETPRQPCRNCTFQHTPFLHELCLGHGIKC